MNQDAFLKLAYQYGVLQALDEAGILKHAQGFQSIEEMKNQAFRRNRLQQQGLPPNLPSRATSPVQVAKPTQTPKPAMPKPPAPKPTQKAPTTARPPAAKNKPASNLLTKAPGAIERRRKMQRRALHGF